MAGGKMFNELGLQAVTIVLLAVTFVWLAKGLLASL
jgi:hypothetical protein